MKKISKLLVVGVLLLSLVGCGCRKKTQIYTFNISFIYSTSECIAIFIDIVICNVNIYTNQIFLET